MSDSTNWGHTVLCGIVEIACKCGKGSESEHESFENGILGALGGLLNVSGNDELETRYTLRHTMPQLLICFTFADMLDFLDVDGQVEIRALTLQNMQHMDSLPICKEVYARTLLVCQSVMISQAPIFPMPIVKKILEFEC